MQHLIDHGVKLIGVYDSGAAIASGNEYQDRSAFTGDISEVSALISGTGDKEGRAQGTPINMFRFIPKDIGFICFDIDRGHDDGIDGLQEFYRFFERIGKPRDLMPAALQDIEGGSFPCCVSTPSGGYHLYFKYKKELGQQKIKWVITHGVEIKYHVAINAPGSIKEKGPYILHGNLEDAPDLYPFIESFLFYPKTIPKFRPFTRENKQEATWKKLKEWVDRDGPYPGRNNRCFSFARKACYFGFSEQETLLNLKADPSIRDLPYPEIKSTISSAYKRKQYE